jgi:HSP20 family protein
MADIIRWEPFRELTSLREAMDQLFEGAFVSPSRILPGWAGGEVALDMYHTDKDVIVKASLPGVKPDEVKVSITGDVLTIEGEHKEEKEVKEADYFRKERRYGAFSRSVVIPVPVKSEKAEAEFEDGVLTLTLPKTEEVKPKQIQVKAKKSNEAKK